MTQRKFTQAEWNAMTIVSEPTATQGRRRVDAEGRVWEWQSAGKYVFAKLVPDGAIKHGKSQHDPKQEELALSSIASHSLFPGRSSLYIGEVAKALSMSDDQVIALIEEGEIHAINIASEGSKSKRKYYRVPVSAFDAFTRKRKSS